MQINAKIVIETPEDREQLIQGFFNPEEFSSKNLIRINDESEAEIRIVFENVPPQGIIAAISRCRVMEFNCCYGISSEEECNTGKCLDQEKGFKTEAEERKTCEDSSEAVSCDEEESTEKAEEKENGEENKHRNSQIIKYKRTGRQKPSPDDYIKLAIFNKAASESSTTKEFVKKVCDPLNLSEEDEDYILRMLTDLLKLKQRAYSLTTKQLKEANSKVGHKAYTIFSNKINKSLLEFNVDTSSLHFFCTMLKYAKKIEKKLTNSETDEVISEGELNSEDDTNAIENANHTEEFPKSKFFLSVKFVEIFNNINKKLPRGKQIKELIKGFGISENSSMFMSIIAIAEIAMDVPDFASVETLMDKAGFAPFSPAGTRTRLEMAEKVRRVCNDFLIPEMNLTEFFSEIKKSFT